MSMPRIAAAAARASSGVRASLTPPALPRPPVFTCALTTVTPPMRSAAAAASSGVVATSPRPTGTPYLWNSCLAWYSNRSTLNVVRFAREVRGNRLVGRRRADVGAYPLDDVLHRGAGREDLCDADSLQLGDVGVRDDAAAEHHHVGDVLLGEQLHGLGEQGHVRAGQHREPDRAGIAQRTGDDLRATVVPVQARLRDDNPDAISHAASSDVRRARSGVSVCRPGSPPVPSPRNVAHSAARAPDLPIRS